MRGNNNEAPQMFCTFHLEDKIRKDHPLRKIKQVADQVLKKMEPVFRDLYSHTGRPSIPPEVLLNLEKAVDISSIIPSPLMGDHHLRS